MPASSLFQSPPHLPRAGDCPLPRTLQEVLIAFLVMLLHRPLALQRGHSLHVVALPCSMDVTIAPSADVYGLLADVHRAVAAHRRRAEPGEPG